MKTPREILLQRHQAVEPKLDRIQAEVLSAELEQHTKLTTPNLPLSIILKLWRELVWPCRRAWTGLAAVWIVLLIINVANRDSTKLAGHSVATLSPATLLALAEQQRLLAELTQPQPVEPAETPRPASPPRPRTAIDTPRRIG